MESKMFFFAAHLDLIEASWCLEGGAKQLPPHLRDWWPLFHEKSAVKNRGPTAVPHFLHTTTPPNFNSSPPESHDGTGRFPTPYFPFWVSVYIFKGFYCHGSLFHLHPGILQRYPKWHLKGETTWKDP